MAKKVLIPIYKKEVAPRFDLALEALIVTVEEGALGKEKIIVVPHASAEEMCNLIINEKVDVVICGGIEEEHYQYLLWKKVQVYDSVVGSYKHALEKYKNGILKQGDILEHGHISRE